MKLFISEGKCYRNRKYNKPKLSTKDRKYLTWSTSYRDKSWIYFSQIEDDFRILHSPYSPKLT